MSRWLGSVALACGLALGVAPTGSTQPMRYCVKPNGPGAFLAASGGVSCALAHRVEAALTATCYRRTRCVVEGFRCVAYWSGRFDQRFEITHHALCVNGWRWVVWDGG